MCRFNLIFVWCLRLEETYLALNLTRARVLDNTSDITEARASEFGEIVLDGLSRSMASSISNSNTRITRRTCVVTITNSATRALLAPVEDAVTI